MSHYRYPFNASEIFNCEVNDIISLFFISQKQPVQEAKAVEEEKSQKTVPTEASESATTAAAGEVQTGQEVATQPTTSLTPAAEEPVVAAPTTAEPPKKTEEETQKQQESEKKEAPASESAIKSETPAEPAAKEEKQQEPVHVEQEKVEDTEEVKETKETNETNETKETKEIKEAKADEDEGNVLQEEQPENKNAPKAKFGLLEKLLSFVKTETEVNPVLAGYFCKVMQVIVEKRKLDLLEYIFTYREHIYNVLKHSYNKSVSEVLSKILSNEDKFITGTTGEEYAPEKKEVLEKMIGKMEPTNSIEDITNNCFILCNLVDTKQHLSYFLAPEVVKKIYQIGITGHPMSLRACLTFFMTMIRTKTSAASAQTTADTFGFSSTQGSVCLIVQKIIH